MVSALGWMTGGARRWSRALWSARSRRLPAGRRGETLSGIRSGRRFGAGGSV